MQIIPHSRIEAVMRRDAAKAEDYAKRHGINKWYLDADQLINDPKVNAIYIATPPKYHLELTVKAATAGKLVYVEKPMARTFAECEQMIVACEENDVPLFVAYYRRALPHFLRIKELLDQGEIGSVRTVHINLKQSLSMDLLAHTDSNWRVIPEISGGGYFFDLASHQLDLLDFFFGPIQKASGYATNQAGRYEAEDMVVGSFAFENGILGSGNWCFTTATGSETDETQIIGSKGEIHFATFGKGEFQIKREGKDWERESYELPAHIQEPLIASIISELRGKGKCYSTGISGSRANWVMDEITKSKN